MDKYLNNSLTPGLRLMAFSLPFALMAAGFYFYSQPYTYVVRGETAIVCDNEKVYPAKSNNIIGADSLLEASESGLKSGNMEKADFKARKLCAYGTTSDFIPFLRVPAERNYTVRLGTSRPVAIEEDQPNVTLSKE